MDMKKMAAISVFFDTMRYRLDEITGHIDYGQMDMKKMAAISVFFDTMRYRLDEITGHIDYGQMDKEYNGMATARIEKCDCLTLHSTLRKL
ncbi:Pyridoxal phosphate-dependent transferase [Artemisia annua]|uniref:Pyridoxal phosphate-dependent transferase n=1 Tax=Artemisia annua TaxID=35608 RepID=A0A2U1P8L5_ARTAN|nr:Pyridoxal phosphate-dependent transferase [Artemisia annua]